MVAIGCVLLPLTGLTMLVIFRVVVAVAEVLNAVDNKVVIPATSPVFSSPVVPKAVILDGLPGLLSPAVGRVAVVEPPHGSGISGISGISGKPSGMSGVSGVSKHAEQTLGVLLVELRISEPAKVDA